MSSSSSAYPFGAARFPVDMDALKQQTPYLHHKITTMKPLREFFNTSKIALPKSIADWRRRLLVNLRYYQSNYLVVLVIVSLLDLIQRPWLLIALASLVAGVVSLKRHPSDEIRYNNISVDKKYLYGALLLITVPVVLFSSPLATVLSIATISALLVAIHASLLDNTHTETSFNEEIV
ncbi:CYFA0S11e01090g1_1 [Cyberlindnera fabianii]|uniref:PRA1 family protein n=1 Tax=Cyberlindnera fabianii TaxID=36022 RepID=A0A061B108_CYBFA|nr:CYFA0S11e01090g1_1 [Cyberlindnera fabianii]